jgi:hypothetical protein
MSGWQEGKSKRAAHAREEVMKMTIDIPAVGECTVSECAYNKESMCHAKAITVGDGDTPHCDTLFCGSEHVRSDDIEAGVGACKVSSCSLNDDLECTADRISVGLKDDSVECLTYTMR